MFSSIIAVNDTNLSLHLYGISVHLIENNLIFMTKNVFIWLLKQRENIKDEFIICAKLKLTIVINSF